jgi:hypothetical protein
LARRSEIAVMRDSTAPGVTGSTVFWPPAATVQPAPADPC